MLKKTIETVNKLNQSIELNIEPFFTEGVLQVGRMVFAD